MDNGVEEKGIISAMATITLKTPKSGNVLNSGIDALPYYGAALATSMRPDLATHCERSILEDVKVGKN